MRLRTLPAATLMLFAARPLVAQQKPDLTPFLADRVEEIALARSAAPHHVSDSATVLVLGPSGFDEAVHGSNGFTCLVMRSFSGSTRDPGFWNAKVRAPTCFNPPAVQTVLAPVLERARRLVAGERPMDVDARTREAYESGRFSAPAPGAMAFMLSPRQYLLDDDPHWLPHLMFYYDRTMRGSLWGVAGPDAPVIDATAGDADAPVQVIFVPVRRWSDGSAAPVTPGH